MNPLCGLLALIAYLATADATRRVIGGEAVQIGEHNYQTSLRLLGGHNCGASLLSNTRALTAAHCVASTTESYSILAGSSDRTVQTCATCALRTLTGVVRHANFSNNPSDGYPNDVAVLRFNSIAYNSNIGFIELATEEDGNFTDISCVVTGWGITASGATVLPNQLQRAAMTVISEAQCQITWGITRINEQHMCALENGSTVCTGDNGGPLVCEGKLAGLFSWGEGQCNDWFPSVFVRISYQRDWILENM